jgi:hypothetical protein
MRRDVAALFGSARRIVQSRDHFKAALMLAAAGALSIWQRVWLVAPFVIVLANVYLLLMLWACASKSAEDRFDPWPDLPYRHTALFVVLFLYASFVFAYGSLYCHVGISCKPWGGVHTSFMNFTTFSYDSLAGHEAVSTTQALSAVVLLICAIPLAISRIGMWESDSRKPDVDASSQTKLDFHGCTIFAPLGTRAIPSGETEYTWPAENHELTLSFDEATQTVIATVRLGDVQFVEMIPQGRYRLTRKESKVV